MESGRARRIGSYAQVVFGGIAHQTVPQGRCVSVATGRCACAWRFGLKGRTVWSTEPLRIVCGHCVVSGDWDGITGLSLLYIRLAEYFCFDNRETDPQVSIVTGLGPDIFVGDFGKLERLNLGPILGPFWSGDPVGRLGGLSGYLGVPWAALWPSWGLLGLS